MTSLIDISTTSLKDIFLKMTTNAYVEFWINDEDLNCPKVREEIKNAIKGIDRNLSDDSVYGTVRMTKVSGAVGYVEFQQYANTRSYYRCVYTTVHQDAGQNGFMEWTRVSMDNNYERFTVSSPTSSNMTYLRQNCYKYGKKIHIEFAASVDIDMPNTHPWAVVNEKYAPNTKYGSNTGHTGIFTLELNASPFVNVCGAYVNPPANGTTYGLVYQGISSKVPANTRVQFLIEYYI